MHLQLLYKDYGKQGEYNDSKPKIVKVNKYQAKVKTIKHSYNGYNVTNDMYVIPTKDKIYTISIESTGYITNKEKENILNSFTINNYDGINLRVEKLERFFSKNLDYIIVGICAIIGTVVSKRKKNKSVDNGEERKTLKISFSTFIIIALLIGVLGFVIAVF